MNKALMQAILAMDSYNRGYNAGIKFGLSSDNSDSAINGVTQLGKATVYLVKGDSAAEEIGFYGIAYHYNGEVIVAYRGLDEKVTLTAKDFLHGFGVGGGDADTEQSRMAIQFYQAVVNELHGTPPSGQYDQYYSTANVSLTGHSMGCVLA